MSPLLQAPLHAIELIGAHDVWPSELEQFTRRLAETQRLYLPDRTLRIDLALEERERGEGYRSPHGRSRL